jgi:hypothetical protein
MDAGFAFVAPHRRVDWGAVESVSEPSELYGREVRQGRADEALGRVLADVMFGRVELDVDFERRAELRGGELPPGQVETDEKALKALEEEKNSLRVLKAMRVAQYSTQYLHHCQNLLVQRCEASEEHLNIGIEQLKISHEKFLQGKHKKKQLRKELGKLDDLIAHYDATLKVLRPDLAELVEKNADGSIHVNFPTQQSAAVNTYAPQSIAPEKALDLNFERQAMQELDEDFRAFAYWQHKMKKWRSEAGQVSSLSEKLAHVEQQLRDLEASKGKQVTVSTAVQHELPKRNMPFLFPAFML